MIWVQLAMFVVSFLITAFFAPKPRLEDARASGLDDLKFPQASEGTPVGFLLGKRRIRAPNTLWYGDFSSVPITKKVKTGLFSSKRVIVGYKYYTGFDLGLTLGPDAHLHTVWVDKDEVWSGDIGPNETEFNIDEENLFGGQEQGGGFVSTCRFYGGNFTQPANAYVEGVVGDTVPGYVGKTHVVFEKAYIGTAAQLRPMSFECSRYTQGLGMSSAINLIGDDINPAEALYQVLISDWGGLDVDPNDIDTGTFTTAGQTLADEGNGVSLLITQPNGGKSVVEEILRQIDGVLFQDPVTGRIELKLIREDYDVLSLPELGPGKVHAVRDFSRTSWDDTYNQVRIVFVNRENKYEKSAAIAQDMANVNSQGRLRSTNISFPLCSNGTLGQELASRELSQYSVPLYKTTLEVNRTSTQLRPGDVFALTWPDYNLTRLVMRIQRFNLGELLDGRVVLECIQDKFAVNATVFAEPEPSLHEVVDRSAQDVTQAMVTEAPYWLLQQQEEVLQPEAQRTYPLVLAREPGQYQQGYSATIEDTLVVDHVLFTNTALLSGSLSKTSGFASGNIPSIIINQPKPGSDWLESATTTEMRAGKNLFFLNGELMAFQGLTDNGNGTWTLSNVRRGLLDTRVADHANGDVLYFVSIDGLSTGDVAATALITAYLQTFTGKDETVLADAPTFTHTPSRRYEKALPPDYVRIASSRTPATIISTGPHTVDWRERNRTRTDIAFQDDATETQEASVTYTLRFYLNDVLQGGKTQTGLTGTSTNITFDSPTVGTGRIEMVAVLGGLESYTAGWIEFAVNVS